MSVNENGEIIKKGRKTAEESTSVAYNKKQAAHAAAGGTCPSQYKNKGTDAEVKSNVGALMELYKLPQIDIDDENEVEKRVYEYFAWVDKWQIKPSLSALALSLGVSRPTLLNWQCGKTRNGTNHFFIIQKAKSLITSCVEDNGTEGKVNPVYTMFLLNNSNQGFTNKNQVEVVQESQTIEAPDVSDMIEDYGIEDE